MAKIIGRIIGDEGINFLYYFGDMTSSERTQNLETFRTDGEVKVIIMGFKCAGQGLDMPHANRVILVDPCKSSTSLYSRFQIILLTLTRVERGWRETGLCSRLAQSSEEDDFLHPPHYRGKYRHGKFHLMFFTCDTTELVNVMLLQK